MQTAHAKWLALKRPTDRGADPVRQLDVGRGDNDAILALLDANDPIGGAFTALAEAVLVGDADDFRAVRPDETAGKRDHSRGVVVVAAVARLADGLTRS